MNNERIVKIKSMAKETLQLENEISATRSKLRGLINKKTKLDKQLAVSIHYNK